MNTAGLIYRLYHIISRKKSSVWAGLFQPDCSLLGVKFSRVDRRNQLQIGVTDLCPFCQCLLYLLSDLNSFSGLVFVLSSKSSRYCLAFFTKVYSLATTEVQRTHCCDRSAQEAHQLPIDPRPSLCVAKCWYHTVYLSG